MTLRGKYILIIVILIIVVLLVMLYSKYAPDSSHFFPKCPFLMLTGYECPGCGSQRAIHSVLNMDIIGALRYNILVPFAIPYIIVGLWCQLVLYFFPVDSTKKVPIIAKKINDIFFRDLAVKIILVLVISYFILRNIL